MKDLDNKFPIFKNSNCRDNECVPASGSKRPIIQVHTYTVESVPKDPVVDTCSDVGRHSCGICEYSSYQILGDI